MAYAFRSNVAKGWTEETYGPNVVIPLLSALVRLRFTVTYKNFKNGYSIASGSVVQRSDDVLLCSHLISFFLARPESMGFDRRSIGESGHICLRHRKSNRAEDLLLEGRSQCVADL